MSGVARLCRSVTTTRPGLALGARAVVLVEDLDEQRSRHDVVAVGVGALDGDVADLLARVGVPDLRRRAAPVAVDRTSGRERLADRVHEREGGELQAAGRRGARRAGRGRSGRSAGRGARRRRRGWRAPRPGSAAGSVRDGPLSKSSDERSTPVGHRPHLVDAEPARRDPAAEVDVAPQVVAQGDGGPDDAVHAVRRTVTRFAGRAGGLELGDRLVAGRDLDGEEVGAERPGDRGAATAAGPPDRRGCPGPRRPGRPRLSRSAEVVRRPHQVPGEDLELGELGPPEGLGREPLGLVELT